jgi:16S rRNA (cytosine967-C5)-methyltransferase
LVKTGGRLIYATCSLLRDENEAIAEQFLTKHPEFKLLNAAEILKQQQIDLDTGDYLKLLPHLHQTDGFFAAVFEKMGVDATPEIVAVAEVDETIVDATKKAKVKTAKIAKSKNSKTKEST